MDLRGRRLLRAEDLALSASLTPADGVISAGLVPNRKTSPWERLLGRFRPLPTPEFHASTPVKQSVRDVIQTSGQSCHAKARRLSPAKMKTAKDISTNCFGLSAVARALSLLLFTWPRRKVTRGTFAEIIGSSTNKLYPTVIPFHTFKMSLGTWMTAAFSRKST